MSQTQLCNSWGLGRESFHQIMEVIPNPPDDLGNGSNVAARNAQRLCDGRSKFGIADPQSNFLSLAALGNVEIQKVLQHFGDDTLGDRVYVFQGGDGVLEWQEADQFHDAVEASQVVRRGLELRQKHADLLELLHFEDAIAGGVLE